MAELIADIAVNIPLKQLFSYRVPESLVAAVKVGMRTDIPFGRRTTIGFILALREGQAEGLKDINGLPDKDILLSAGLIKLLRWAADYYCHPIGQVVRSALPAGLGSDKNTTKILTEQVYTSTDCSAEPKGQKQKEILAYVCANEPVTHSQIAKEFSASQTVLKRLVELGCLTSQQQEKIRDPFLLETLPEDKNLTLTEAQELAIGSVKPTIVNGEFAGFLLHGVTGSGKTEVYLHLVAASLAANKQVLVLVPEISLTPQLVARFRARFEASGSRIAVLHSGLSAGERYDAWREIIRDQVQIVIGARSAVFAPIQNLGLIIVDEEHESSYKQGEGFRYNGRDLALMLGQQHGCPVLLGSATPSFASYYRSEQGMISRLSLDRRVHDGDLPSVEVVDLRGQVLEGEITNELQEAIELALEKDEQVLLLLNRRGFSPFVLCADCGESFHCPNCEITLTYHQYNNQLRCHYCDYANSVPEQCGKCNGANIEPQGAGTEKLEQELNELFPAATIVRMDRDTTTRKGSHKKIITAMMERKIDILVGTQMIAKGHDFPGVSLVGVLGADTVLNFPDFRSGERSFSLFTQVAGRAGRDSGGGRVYIQSYNPEHYALTCAAQQDYHDFYQQELPFRQELGYPPCGFLANLVFAGNNSSQVAAVANELCSYLFTVADGVDVLGPSPCPLAKLRGKTRYQVLLKSTARGKLRNLLTMLESETKNVPNQVTLTIDVDPIDML